MPAYYEKGITVVNDQVNSQGRKIRTVPWHGLGEFTPDLISDEDAKAAIGWTVRKDPLYRQRTLDNGETILEQVKAYCIVREVDDKVVGQHVGTQYSAFQNEALIDFGSALVDEFGAKWDTVASLKGGSLVFASLRLEDVLGSIKVAGMDSEAHDLFLLISNAHDGSRALKAAITPIRTVCTNTEAWALRDAKATWSLRHTGTLDDRVREAQDALGLVTAYMESFNETAQKLLDAELTVADIEKFVAEMVPVPKEKGKAQAIAQRDDLTAHIFGTVTVPKDIRSTAYGVLQSSTEFFEHEVEGKFRKATPVAERKVLSTLFGGPVALKRDKAFSLLAK